MSRTASAPNPTAATTLQALATIYAVLVAFVIVDEYTTLRNTQSQVATKAAQLGVIFENSRNLAPADGSRVQAAAIRYARFTVKDGLPELVRTAQPSPRSDAALEDITGWSPRSSPPGNRARSPTSRS